MKYDTYLWLFKSLKKATELDKIQLHKYVMKCVTRDKKRTL